MANLRLRYVWCCLFWLAVAGCAGNRVAPDPAQPPDAVHDTAARAVITSTATPVPTPTPSGLYTNAQLRTAPDPQVPRIDPAFEAWVAARAVPVRSETYDQDFSDLAPFGKAVCDKRIVGLGESSHGVGDYSDLKVRLIKYLHEKCGFDVIAWESGMFDNYVDNQHLQSISPMRAMHDGIYGLWWETEVLELFKYLKAQAATAHPLTLAGIDVQEYVANAQREKDFHDVIAPVDPAYALQVADRDGYYLNLVLTAEDKPSKAALAALHAAQPHIDTFYAALAAWMDAHLATLESASTNDRNLPGLLRQAASVTPAFARSIYLSIARPNNAAQDDVRDAGMASDVSYLANTLYKGKKIILWAHNAHVARGGEGFHNMGSQIEAAFGSQYYATGLLPLRGQGNYLPGPAYVYTVVAPPAHSIDATLYYSRWRWAYVDLKRSPAVPGNAWMTRAPLAYEFIGIYNYSYADVPAVPDHLFDGVMYVDTIHPPHYLIPRHSPGAPQWTAFMP